MRKAVHNLKLGDVFNLLTVVEIYKDSEGRWLARCRCECGNFTKNTRPKSLETGKTKSCGCYSREVIKNGRPKTTSHINQTRVYRILTGVKNRCLNPNEPSYHNYGARGITVCDEWLDKDNGYLAFYSWAMSNGYQDDLTLDRKDNNGNYEPSNCRWTTMGEQQRNRRNSKVYSFNGFTGSIYQIIEKFNLPLTHGAYWHRINSGMPVEEAFTRESCYKNRSNNNA